MVKVASVKYLDNNSYGQSYDFFTDIEDLKIGDTVVVDSKYGLGLAKVELVMQQPQCTKDNKWVVQKVDLTAHEARLVKAQKLADIKRKMESRRKKLEEKAIYKMMAETDPEMAALLAEYEGVDGQ
jgi:hypothetical protein